MLKIIYMYHTEDAIVICNNYSKAFVGKQKKRTLLHCGIPSSMHASSVLYTANVYPTVVQPLIVKI